MKKLFTLCISLIIAFALNAQLTESGNGLMEMFDYEDGTVLTDVTFEEGLAVEWPVEESTVVQGGMLTWDMEMEEVSWGFGVEPAMDLSGDAATLSFKYQIPAESGINLYFLDSDFGEGWLELTITAGTDELQEITVDLLDTEPIEENFDLSKVIEFYILPFITTTTGTCYLDDIMLGDASNDPPSGLNQVSVSNNLEVYPNPATTNLSIGVDAALVVIYNTVGQEVQSITNYLKGTPVNIEHLNNGVYFIKADDKAQKLIIQ